MKTPVKGLAPAAVLLAALAAASLGAPPAQTRPAQASRAGLRPVVSLCRAQETVLFTCAVATKTVSVCGDEPEPDRGQGRAVYRFGRPGRVELEATDLHFAHRGFSGGGEEQVLADTPTHRYIVYTEIHRTAFGSDGHHDPQAESGLFVQRGVQTISSQRCAEPTTFKQVVWTLLPAGEYVPH